MGKGKRMFGMTDRVVVFEPEQISSVLKEMNLTVADLATKTGIKKGTLRKYVSLKSENMSLHNLDLITQAILEFNRNRKFNKTTLPKRVYVINPTYLKGELEKRCITLSYLKKKLKNKMSETMIKNYVHEKFPTNGPMYRKYKLISDCVLAVPKKTQDEIDIFKKDDPDYDVTKDKTLTDDVGAPKLADGMIWDFRESQKQFLAEDAKKLKNLPRRGRLTTLDKKS